MADKFGTPGARQTDDKDDVKSSTAPNQHSVLGYMKQIAKKRLGQASVHGTSAVTQPIFPVDRQGGLGSFDR